MTNTPKQVWHDYPMGDEPTKCCGLTAQDLPLDVGMTSDPKRVTCDGSVAPVLMAHEVYPHPSDLHDEPPTLDAAIKYHLARCLALYPARNLSVLDSDPTQWMDRINLYLGERHIACLMIALHKGMTGQEAVNEAHAWSCGDDAELVYDLARDYGVELHRIKPYGFRRAPEPAPNPSDWTMLWDNGVTYPFVEDENANITGMGHQDRAEFARLVNHYDEACNGAPCDESDQWSAEDIGHRWAVVSPDGERLMTKLDGKRVGPDTPKAVPITTLWGQR